MSPPGHKGLTVLVHNIFATIKHHCKKTFIHTSIRYQIGLYIFARYPKLYQLFYL